MTVRLHALEGCPDCERVMEALDEAGVPYEVTWVEAEFSTRNEVRKLSGQRGVPVIEDTERGVIMANAARIIEYVEKTLA
ncbi:MAG: glutaredoxin family protein [Halodesulfurarchaeum sp.]